MFKLDRINNNDSLSPAEKCWETGEYIDDCICDFCSHKYECSGYDSNDDEDEE